MSPEHEIFIIAGELSGDIIGSMLIKQLKKLDPSLQVTGLGGNKMEEAGARILVNLPRDLAIIGFAEVISKFPKIRRVFHDSVQYLRQNRPECIVLIDYPGFNLRIAEQAHKLGIKVIYYVCPQVWAWHKSRISKMRQFIDKALVILPFEEPFYSERNLDAEYVGTPWLDMMVLTMRKEEVFEHFDFDPGKKLIGLLPGSRRREVETMLPVMIEAAEKIHARRPDTQFVIPRATTVKQEIVDHLLTMSKLSIKVVDAYRYNVRNAMDFAIVVSGTATLETGLLGVPMAIIYKVAYLSWLIGKNLVNIPYIGLINIVAGDMVCPELIQDQCTPQNIADRVLKILNDERELEKIKYQLSKVKEKMGGPGASARVANIVLETISQSVVTHDDHGPESPADPDNETSPPRNN
jgi:lipid-A-disaccharide synthase